MEQYLQALDMLQHASELMENMGETALVAHLALPIALLTDRLRAATTVP